MRNLGPFFSRNSGQTRGVRKLNDPLHLCLVDLFEDHIPEENYSDDELRALDYSASKHLG